MLICFRSGPFSRFINEKHIQFQVKKNSCAARLGKLHDAIRKLCVLVNMKRWLNPQNQYDNIRANNSKLHRRKIKKSSKPIRKYFIKNKRK